MTYLDSQVLGTLLEVLGEDDLFEITERFVEQFEIQLRELDQSLACGDLAGCARVAHSLKGGGGNIGANALSDAAAALERHARAGDAVMAVAIMESVPDIARNTVAELMARGYVRPRS
jgi:HPt (histidine-containing phosphotransfer) domain-containing protein